MSDDPAFALGGEQPLPNAFIQWKGTDVCMDFWCECGAYHHIDAYFVYAVKCHECGVIWQMPSHIYPRKVDSYDGIVHQTTPDEGDDVS